LASTTQNLAETQQDRNNFRDAYEAEKSRIDDIAGQVGSITNVVSSIQKTNSVDLELLAKYSKVYFLNENYTPQKLSPIDVKYIDPSKKELLFLDKVLPHLEKMMADAYASSTDIKVLSTYRSYKTQGELKYNYTIIYGSGANKFSADQGYSEHQLGTAMDFTTSKMRQSLTTSFNKTPAYKWLTENAHKYGFILSYPRNNGFYQFEPWHWRFIGVDFATRLHDEGKVFYDLDQRLIDTYLLGFFD